jgi:hypothetical protein
VTDLGDTAAPGAPAPRPRRLGVSAAVAACGLVLGGIGVAGLAGATDADPASSAGATPSAQATPDGSPGRDRPGPGGRHGGMLGGIEGHAVHGEIVIETDDGFVTVQTQRGAVTAVSDSSISVRSADGFTATYVIDDDTSFGRSSEGAAGIAEGDTVRVVGKESGSALTALLVHGGDWAPGGRGPGGRTASPTPSPSAEPDAAGSALA